MPILRYTLQIEGANYTLDEQDTFAPTDDPTATIAEQILKPLQDQRAKLKEPAISLVNVVVINPYVHLHTWKRFRVDKFACKNHYECTRCKITGFKKINLFTGEYGGLSRDEAYKNDRKYYLCHDPLKPMPFSTKLVFR